MATLIENDPIVLYKQNVKFYILYEEKRENGEYYRWKNYGIQYTKTNHICVLYLAINYGPINGTWALNIIRCLSSENDEEIFWPPNGNYFCSHLEISNYSVQMKLFKSCILKELYRPIIFCCSCLFY